MLTRIGLYLAALLVVHTHGESLPGIPAWQVARATDAVAGADVIVIGFADPEVCYPALTDADENNDGLVKQEEYVDFVKAMGPEDFLDDVDTFAELPLILQNNFYGLACLCQVTPVDDSCCVGDNAAILTDGAGEGEVPTPEEQSYLFLVCSLTDTAIKRVLSSYPPSPQPTGQPGTVAPTVEPTATPTVAPTKSPTRPPTVSPTKAPSAAPTKSPTAAPTESPTAAPTKSPTAEPTATPTLLPSLAPTGSPTDAHFTLRPSASPTEAGPTLPPTTLTPTALPTTSAPTAAPTTSAPTVSPAPSTSAPTTSAPTTGAPTISPAPTPAVIEEEVETIYQIAIRNNAPEDEYRPQLTNAMYSLSNDVLLEILGRRQLRVSRRLQTVEVPTEITAVDSTETCANVTAVVTLIFQAGDGEPDEVAGTFLVELEESIAEGELQDALVRGSPDTNVYIVDDTIVVPSDDDGPGDNDRTLESGGIAGVVIGSLAFLILLLGLLAARRRPAEEKEVEELEPAPQELDLEVEEEQEIKYASLGAASPDYGKGKDAMMDNDEAVDDAVDPANMSHDSSSNAGSSGWSSSAGVSSLNTGSETGLSPEPHHIAGAGSADLAALTARIAKASEGASVPSVPVVTRADLDTAIEAGDWAAVGATAALLAAGSDSQSASSKSADVSARMSASREGGASLGSSLDAVRAAELDNLVETGDWEGVVLAAAKFEVDSSRGGSASGSESRSNTEQQTQDSSVASSASKAEKRKELRAEVEDLVRRVVPEEIQNVDEMMLQFRGREEELVETLKTMQERAVAQKARQGAQKAAKVQAKRKTAEDRAADATALLAAIPGPGSDDSDDADENDAAQAASGDEGSDPFEGTEQAESQPAAKSLGTGTVEPAKRASKKTPKQSALEKAIAAGDWEAVGEAAAMLSDHSMASSADSAEIKRLAEGLSSNGSDAGEGDGKADELEELIERGDWEGVVQAAGTPPDDAKAESAASEAKRQKRLKHLKEEEEALAQAEIWEAIAQQTRQEADQPAQRAASDAADWAIGRSLQALVQAEQGERLTGEESSKSDPDLVEEEV